MQDLIVLIIIGVICYALGLLVGLDVGKNKKGDKINEVSNNR